MSVNKKPSRKYLFVSKIPDKIFLEMVFNYSLELPVAPTNKKIYGNELIVTGTLEEILEILNKNLQLDYAEHQNDFQLGQPPYEVEYIITQDGYPDYLLDISTKLFSVNQDGSVFYGFLLLKSSSINYQLYGDDEIAE